MPDLLTGAANRVKAQGAIMTGLKPAAAGARAGLAATGQFCRAVVHKRRDIVESCRHHQERRRRTNSRRKFHKLLLAFGVLLLFGLSAVLLGLESAQSQARSAPVATVRKKESGPSNPGEARRFRRLQMQDEKGFIPPDGLEKDRKHVALIKAAQQERKKAGSRVLHHHRQSGSSRIRGRGLGRAISAAGFAQSSLIR